MKRKLTPRQRERLEGQLRRTRDARVHRRTLAVLEYSRGRSVTHIARTLNVRRMTVYRWLAAFAETRDPAALLESPHPGRERLWTEACTQKLNELMEEEPGVWGWPSEYWTVPLLQAQLESWCGRAFSPDTIRRALQSVGYVWKRPRYVLEPDPEREKKTPNPPSSRPFASRLRGAGAGRDGSVAVSAAARGVG